MILFEISYVPSQMDLSEKKIFVKYVCVCVCVCSKVYWLICAFLNAPEQLLIM